MPRARFRACACGHVVAGSPQQPARLFPYYRDVQDTLGVERIHPSDLLPADIGQGRRVRLAVEAIDLLGPELTCRYLSVMDELVPELIEEEET